jgi:hypothetical protein
VTRNSSARSRLSFCKPLPFRDLVRHSEVLVRRASTPIADHRVRRSNFRFLPLEASNGTAVAGEETKCAGDKSQELGRAMALLKLLNRLFHGPASLTFLFMGIAAGGFALYSFNLLYLFQANFNLIVPTARWRLSTADFFSSSN